jgi:copper chaperone CopZ
MTTFKVEKMSCGGCVKHVTRAVQSVAAGADVAVDLTTGKVDVTPAPQDTQAVIRAITEAGYPATLAN